MKNSLPPPPNQEQEVMPDLIECPVCGGSGFSSPGTGYGDVCSECGGQKYIRPPAVGDNPAAGEIAADLNGLNISDPTRRAEHIMQQMLDGLTVGPTNREQVKSYIAMHLASSPAITEKMVERGARAAFSHSFLQGDYDNQNETIKKISRDLARAVLEAVLGRYP